MTKKQFFSIIDYIVNQGISLFEKYISEENLSMDFVDIFSKDEQEKEELLEIASQLGKIIDRPETGITFLLNSPYPTKAGELRLIKVRNPDKEKSQRGAPDFKVENYNEFKDRYLNLENIKMIKRKDYEMLELRDDNYDILVYFPNKPLSEEFRV